MEKLAKIINGDWSGYYGVIEKLNTNKTMVKLNIYETNPNTPIMISWFNSDDVETL